MSQGQGAILIITMLFGGIFTFFGGVCKTQNAGDMINGFNSKKHDKEKVSKIFGNHFLFIGLSVILVGIIGMVLNQDNYNIFMHIQRIIVIVGVIKTIYTIEKHGKIEKE